MDEAAHVRAALDGGARLAYIEPNDRGWRIGRRGRMVKGDAMLSLFYGLEPNVALHATVLALGCATFLTVLMASRCPHCSWLEWISDSRGDEERPD